MTKKASKPTPITRADFGRLASLKGARLSGVTYHYLPPADGGDYVGGENGVDCDLAALDLDLDDGVTTAITWAMTGELEGLSILDGESYSSIGTEVLDAAGREAWREHIGKRITSVAASWQRPPETATSHQNPRSASALRCEPCARTAPTTVSPRCRLSRRHVP